MFSIDDRIQKAVNSGRVTVPLTRFDRANNPISGVVDGIPAERQIDIQLLENEAIIEDVLRKASGLSQHVVPSFYEGGDDVYIAAKEKADVTVTDADRRAIHTVSNYYNTLGIYRDDFDKTNNDKLARNAYYAICEKAMMDYMRSVQFTVKDVKNGDTIKSATEFFEVPNPQDTMGDIFAALIRDLTRYDAGAIVKSFKKSGYCCEIKPYLATEFWKEQDRVPFIVNVPITNTVDLTGGAYSSHQQPTYQGWWSHGYVERFWQRSRTGVYIPFQPEEICYMMMYPRTDGIYGTDFIKFLKYQIQYLIDSTKAAGKTFENGVVPSVVWEHPEVHTVPQLKQRIAELKFNNQGWQRFGSVIHTVNGEKVSSLAQSLHDMQWLEGQKFVAQLVWATWGFSPEEFMGGGESRASSYVKRNITKSRLLYPMMTYLEGRINRDILPYLKGYHRNWRFQFIRDIELDDEQKVATTNSIKASTFLQYYQSGFPIAASMELSGLDKNQFKFDINLLEAEIMQNQMMMLGQQPGEQGAGGMEDQEMGRYGPGSEGYVDSSIGEAKPGPDSTRDPHDPSMEEQQVHKAYNPENDTPLPRAKPKDRWKEYKEGRSDTVPTEQYEKALPLLAPIVAGAVRVAATAGRAAATAGRAASSAAKTAGSAAKQAGGKVKEISDTVGQAKEAKNAFAPEQKEDDEWKNYEGEKPGLMSRAIVGGAKRITTPKAGPTPIQKGLLSRAIVGGITHVANKYVEKKQAAAEKERHTTKPAKGNDISEGHIPKKTVKTTFNPKQAPRESPNEETRRKKQSRRGPAETEQQRAQRLQKPLVPNRQQTSLSAFNKAMIEAAGKDTRPDQDYEPYSLAQGIRVEMEHTDDENVAKMIAKDHLDEFPEYYRALKKMESGLRKAGLPFESVVPYATGEIIKAKVYITHPSEAPKGRAVRRGNKGGYYYITNERDRGGKSQSGDKRRPSTKHKGGGKGWEVGGGESQEPVAAMPPEPPVIEGAEEQVNISGLGVGLSVGIIGGRLAVKKINNGPTNQFIKIVEKKTGERPSVEKIVDIMIATADEMGLEVELI